MARLATEVFVGRSGAEYEFLAYGRDTEFKAAGAVYVVAMRVEAPAGTTYRHVYVGETRDLADSPLTHCRTACFERMGANDIFIRLDGNQERRRETAADLQARLAPPCNAGEDGLCSYPTKNCPLIWPYGQ